ncbi:PAS domain-containing protein [Pseudenhygromyxa sp. WMMC2535]|uniref:hybrid sensor histidine kinase/response regulator n=1 Tax=Pseudenhygromyxa sp. WMMC2535 TaxID=2712867 RepID=UPI00155544FF|nr:PAS domain-containing sensor histidine kinase [Pseudenhygromyxa sp. WMMC2535]NVB41141.1 PAS domain-containing protein [Pseudenhygromyxa sp. WMMC2535]
MDEVEVLRARVAELEASVAALRQKESQWRLFSLATSDMLWNWDFSDDSVERNIRFESAFGYRSDEVIPSIEWWIERVHEDDRAQLFSVFTRARESGADNYSCEYRFRRRDGGYAIIRDNAFIIRDCEGRPVRALGAMTDISERMHWMEQSRRLANFEALGTLAAGIAHDFNNHIQGIVVATEVLCDSVDVHSRTYRFAAMASQNARALAPLVSQLMTFARGGSSLCEVLDIAQLVVANAELALAGSQLKASFRVPDRPVYAKVDETQIAQVIHNLVINAVQATKGAGQLGIGVRTLDDADADADADAAGPWIEISIRDHGEGMAAEVLDNIFELHYTTKAKGQGLGLAIVRSIVERHGGRIAVSSTLGEGSCFQILLRPTDERPRDRRERGGVEAGVGRILVMDDQEATRGAVALALDILGYEVTTVDEGDAAVAEYRRAMDSDAPYCAVILDLTVPGAMGAIGACEALRAIDPRARVIVTSGYADAEAITDIAGHGFDAALRKPFDTRTLGKTLREVLREEGEGGR